MSFSNPIRPPVAILKNDKFGVRNLGGGNHTHNGVDLRPKSDDILASHDGIVTFVGVDQHGGLYIDLANQTQMTRYLHNRQNLVSKGQTVRRGQLIGYIGQTGRVTGRHLHFETWINGQRVNPESVINFNNQPYQEPAKLAVVASPTVISTPGARYIVKRGDTLSEIVARHYGLSNWPQIKAKYTQVASSNGIKDVNKIYPGQIINLK